MGWAHDGTVTCSIANTATAARTGGLGGEELESVTACRVHAVPGPAAVVLGPGTTTTVPEPPVEVPEPPAWFPESDLAASGSSGTKMELDSGVGLTDGLRRRWRETPVGIACQVEPIRARASACSLSAHGT